MSATRYKVILAGDTGSGKTAQFETYPGRRFADLFDPAADSTLALKECPHEWWLPEAKDLAISRKVKAAPGLYTRWATDFNLRLKDGYFEDVDSYMIDSLTLLGHSCLAEELAAGHKDERMAYRRAGETMTDVMWAIASLPCHVLMTVHTRYGEGDEGRGEHRLTVPGGSKLFLPRFVSALWFTSLVETKDRGPRYHVLTRPQRGWPHVRTPRAWQHLPLYHDVTIDWTHPRDCGIGGLIAQGESS